MIHTIELTHVVPAKDPLYDWWNDRMKKPVPRGITLEVSPTLKSRDGSVIIKYCLRIVVDCLEMFQVQNITLTELPQIIPHIDAALVGSGITSDDFNVYRIDYAHSVVVKDEIARKIIIDMLNEKSPSYANHLYCCHTYKTSFRRDTETHMSRAVNIYDKNEECKAKGKIPKFYERNVIRSELQVYIEHIRYQAKTKVTTRCLSDWLIQEKCRKYINQVSLFDFWADFYSLPMAERMIDASEYTGTEKKRLKAFLKKIADTDADTAFAGYSRPTVKKYIGLLTRINVNPITIPEEYGISHIESPFWP